MKLKKHALPILVVIAIIYFNTRDNKPSPPSTQAPVQLSALTTYGEMGAATSWPPIREGVANVSEQLHTPNYYIVLDASGSMAGPECADGRRKIDVARDALADFVERLPANANVGLFAFDIRGIGERVPLQAKSDNRIRQALTSLEVGGGTPLYAAVSAGDAALTQQGQKQLGYGEYHLVVVTDGEANPGEEPDAAVGALLERSPIVLHTIGFCIGIDHSLNQKGYTVYRSANDPDSLAAGLDAVLAEAPDFSVAEFKE